MSQMIENKPLYLHLQGMNKQAKRNEYLINLLPLNIERKIDFLLTQVHQDAYFCHLKWFQDSLQQDGDLE